MAKQAVAVTIEERTEALRKERGDNVSVDDIGSVVLSLVEGTAPDNEVDKIASELRDLLDFIGAAKAELVGMQPKSLSRRDIPDAGEQLDAIVEATEDAASTIMDAADSMMEIAAEVEAPQAEKLEAVSTELFQASSFQDLTGQRITKVTKPLDIWKNVCQLWLKPLAMTLLHQRTMRSRPTMKAWQSMILTCFMGHSWRAKAIVRTRSTLF